MALSRSTQDAVKTPFYDTLVMLTELGCESSKEAKSKDKYKYIINILNCIGTPSLCTELTHNFHSNTIIYSGIAPFCEWFSALLQLPFEEW